MPGLQDTKRPKPEILYPDGTFLGNSRSYQVIKYLGDYDYSVPDPKGSKDYFDNDSYKRDLKYQDWIMERSQDKSPVSAETYLIQDVVTKERFMLKTSNDETVSKYIRNELEIFIKYLKKSTHVPYIIYTSFDSNNPNAMEVANSQAIAIYSYTEGVTLTEYIKDGSFTDAKYKHIFEQCNSLFQYIVGIKHVQLYDIISFDDIIVSQNGTFKLTHLRSCTRKISENDNHTNHLQYMLNTSLILGLRKYYELDEKKYNLLKEFTHEDANMYYYEVVNNRSKWSLAQETILNTSSIQMTQKLINELFQRNRFFIHKFIVKPGKGALYMGQEMNYLHVYDINDMPDFTNYNPVYDITPQIVTMYRSEINTNRCIVVCSPSNTDDVSVLDYIMQQHEDNKHEDFAKIDCIYNVAIAILEFLELLFLQKVNLWQINLSDLYVKKERKYAGGIRICISHFNNVREINQRPSISLITQFIALFTDYVYPFIRQKDNHIFTAFIPPLIKGLNNYAKQMGTDDNPYLHHTYVLKSIFNLHLMEINPGEDEYLPYVRINDMEVIGRIDYDLSFLEKYVVRDKHNYYSELYIYPSDKQSADHTTAESNLNNMRRAWMIHPSTKSVPIISDTEEETTFVYTKVPLKYGIPLSTVIPAIAGEKCAQIVWIFNQLVNLYHHLLKHKLTINHNAKYVNRSYSDALFITNDEYSYKKGIQPTIQLHSIPDGIVSENETLNHDFWIIKWCMKSLISLNKYLNTYIVPELEDIYTFASYNYPQDRPREVNTFINDMLTANYQSFPEFLQINQPNVADQFNVIFDDPTLYIKWVVKYITYRIHNSFTLLYESENRFRGENNQPPLTMPSLLSF